MDFQDEFDEIETAAADRRRQQNIDDYGAETRGDEVGRMPRFLSAEARQNLIDKRNGKQSTAMTALDLMLLNDPHYAKIYSEAMDTLAGYESAAEQALNKAILGAADAKDALQDTIERAATLRDGTSVFRDENGDVWTEHHKKLDDATAAQVEWQGSEPGYAEFKERSDALLDADNLVGAIRQYQIDVLGTARGRLTDPNNPLSADGIAEAIRDVEARTPEAVKSELRTDSPAPSHDTTQSFDLSIPDLSS